MSSSSRFTVSLAPTARAKCRGCKQVIKKGSVRVSREVPSTFTGDKGSIAHHYHLDHGMHAVTRVRCTSPTPSFVVDATLTAAQGRRAKVAGGRALGVWRKRCQSEARVAPPGRGR